MRSELEETRLIDQYLLGQLDKSETQTFEAKLLLDNTLSEKVESQRLLHRLIRLYARKQARRRFETIFLRLLRESSFTDQLKTI